MMFALVFILPKKPLLASLSVLGVGLCCIRYKEIWQKGFILKCFWRLLERQTCTHLTQRKRWCGQVLQWAQDSSGLFFGSKLEFFCCPFSPPWFEIRYIVLSESWVLIRKRPTYTKELKTLQAVFSAVLLTSNFKSLGKLYQTSDSHVHLHPLQGHSTDPSTSAEPCRNNGHNDPRSPSQPTILWLSHYCDGCHRRYPSKCGDTCLSLQAAGSLWNVLAGYVEACHLPGRGDSPSSDDPFTLTCTSGSRPRQHIRFIWGAFKNYGYWFPSPRGSDSISLAWGPGNSVL